MIIINDNKKREKNVVVVALCYGYDVGFNWNDQNASAKTDIKRSLIIRNNKLKEV